jgi:hypothetical protein
MRSLASVPSCFLFLFLSISLGAAFLLQTPAPKAAATVQKESRSARSHYRQGSNWRGPHRPCAGGPERPRDRPRTVARR